ncbi:uncharacterized protein LOC131842632 [Achroia grisella]|uniref:uncharacterized protein LOC131842632 n=1 Tax=Achroia grisella TaxID=688607 RepID=UPI0027D20964|nr:uncharacterized protein LOC131842632 [Achroia grisella]
MYSQPHTYVRSTAGNTSEFSVAVGLHQGSDLSPYLFLLIMDALTSEMQEEAPWCMLFAHDIVLVGEEGAEIQSRLAIWQLRLESGGLKISNSKTEYMLYINDIHDFGGLSGSAAISSPLPICSNFRYLGSLLQSNGELDRTIKHRINSGWMKWRQVTATTCDSRVTLKLKGKIYKTMTSYFIWIGVLAYKGDG